MASPVITESLHGKCLLATKKTIAHTLRDSAIRLQAFTICGAWPSFVQDYQGSPTPKHHTQKVMLEVEYISRRTIGQASCTDDQIELQATQNLH